MEQNFDVSSRKRKFSWKTVVMVHTWLRLRTSVVSMEMEEGCVEVEMFTL